jgi:hypothetical protein
MVPVAGLYHFIQSDLLAVVFRAGGPADASIYRASLVAWCFHYQTV